MMKRLGKFGVFCIVLIVAMLVISVGVDAKKKSNKKLRQNYEKIIINENLTNWRGDKKNKKSNKKYKKNKKNRDENRNYYSRDNQSRNLDNYYNSIATPAPFRSTTTASNSLTQVRINSRVSNVTKQYTAMTVNFNSANRVPNCVSYVLTSEMVDITNGPNAQNRRNYKFYRDPSVSGCPEWYEYRGSGYDRGHMAPANDMRWSTQSMSDCFLMTNICPQDHDLNGGSWNKLELKIHDWAKRYSSIIVATGPIFNGNSQRIGQNNDIVVPAGFFKVVLDPSRNRAIGFVYDNHEGGGGVKRHACSVDNVERITGHDFFSALPDNIENAIESTFSFDQWN